MDFDVQQKLMPHLNSGERLLWTGRPKTGIAFTSGDIFAVPFSIFWFGFACFWMWGAYTSGAPLPFVLFGTPFVLIGLYLLVGRFFYDAWKRNRTWYGLTEERVMIVAASKVESVSLRTLQGVSVSTKSDRSGTITLGPSGGMNAWMAAASWPGARGAISPSLRMIPGAQDVYNQIMRAQQELRR